MILNIWFNVANSTEFKELALLSSSQVYPNVSYGAHEGYHHCIRQYYLYLPASTLEEMKYLALEINKRIKKA